MLSDCPTFPECPCGRPRYGGNEYVPTLHPTKPELPSLYHSVSDTWLVQHDGFWTAYAPRSIWTERCDTSDAAYLELVKVLQRNDPYETEEGRAHRLTVLSRLVAPT